MISLRDKRDVLKKPIEDDTTVCPGICRNRSSVQHQQRWKEGATSVEGKGKME